jgi:hypothetical protein
MDGLRKPRRLAKAAMMQLLLAQMARSKFDSLVQYYRTLLLQGSRQTAPPSIHALANQALANRFSQGPERIQSPGFLNRNWALRISIALWGSRIRRRGVRRQTTSDLDVHLRGNEFGKAAAIPAPK